MNTKKQKRIGKKVGNLVAIMLAVSMLITTMVGIIMSYRLTTNMLRDKCVSGTNILAYALQNNSEQKDKTALLDELKNLLNSK